MALEMVKRTGDKLSATEFNAVVDAINANERKANTNQQNITTQGERLQSMARLVSEQGQSIEDLQNSSATFVQSTDADIATMNENESWQPGVFYFTVEE